MRPRQKPRAFFYIFIFVLPLVFLASSLLVTLTVTSFGCHHSFIWLSAFVRLAVNVCSFGCQRLLIWQSAFVHLAVSVCSFGWLYSFIWLSASIHSDVFLLLLRRLDCYGILSRSMLFLAVSFFLVVTIHSLS